MTAEEALAAATLGGARALRRTDVGHIAPGARADAVLLDAPSYNHLVYRPGVPLVAMTIARGRPAWIRAWNGHVGWPCSTWQDAVDDHPHREVHEKPAGEACRPCARSVVHSPQTLAVAT